MLPLVPPLLNKALSKFFHNLKALWPGLLPAIIYYFLQITRMNSNYS